MHRLAKLSAEASRLSGDIDDWFIKHGYNVDETTSGDSLRSGSGLSLEELEYGNDITDEYEQHQRLSVRVYQLDRYV